MVIVADATICARPVWENENPAYPRMADGKDTTVVGQQARHNIHSDLWPRSASPNRTGSTTARIRHVSR